MKPLRKALKGTVLMLVTALVACSQAATPNMSNTAKEPNVSVRIVGPYTLRSSDFARTSANLYGASISVSELTKSVVDNGLVRAELDIANSKEYAPFPFGIDVANGNWELMAYVTEGTVGFALSAYPSSVMEAALTTIDGFRWRLVLVTPS